MHNSLWTEPRITGWFVLCYPHSSIHVGYFGFSFPHEFSKMPWPHTSTCPSCSLLKSMTFPWWPDHIAPPLLLPKSHTHLWTTLPTWPLDFRAGHEAWVVNYEHWHMVCMSVFCRNLCPLIRTFTLKATCKGDTYLQCCSKQSQGSEHLQRRGPSNFKNSLCTPGSKSCVFDIYCTQDQMGVRQMLYPWSTLSAPLKLSFFTFFILCVWHFAFVCTWSS